MYGCKSLNAHALYLGYKTIQNKAVLQNDKALFLWEMFWWSSIFFFIKFTVGGINIHKTF